jgi:hypothetical protein
VRAGALRCSRLSRDLEEEQRGTASVITKWVLVEQPGPWGYRALVQSRLPRQAAEEIRRRAGRLGIRVVLIRRPGRSSPEGRECFFVHAGEHVQSVERLRVGSVGELLDVDWAPLGRGERVGVGDVSPDPLFLVCTNGARDPCCAERGRGVAAVLARDSDGSVWECSHIGGDRFAANLVCFPHGIYYGRVTPSQAVEIAERYREGVLDLSNYRGRVCYDFATQAAEAFLRQRHDLRGVGEVRLARRTATAGQLDAEFETSLGRERVVVAVERGNPRRLTCRTAEEARPPVFRLVSIEGPG